MTEIESTLKKKICLVTPPYRFSDSAGQVVLSQFIEILEPILNGIFIITGEFKSESNNRIINIKPHEDKKLLLKILKYLINQLKISFTLIKISKNVNIIFFFLGGSLLTVPIILAKILRKQVVLIATGSDSKVIKKQYEKLFYKGKILFLISKILEKINYNLSDRIIVYSENIIDFLELNKYKGKILPIGARFVDTSSFKITENLKDKRNLIGYVGRLAEEKGIMNFVKAIPLILKERNDLDFLIGGDGPLLDEIKNELKNNGSYNKVKFIGWIPHDELPDYLNELKLLILPSYTEGLPNIILESMACGTPVLATSVGGIPDVIKDGESGFILEDNSPGCIAENVMRALNYPNLDGIVKNTRKLIEKEFTYEMAVERYRKILRNIEGD